MTRILGSNRRSYPRFDPDGPEGRSMRDGCPVTVVLVAVDLGDYAAYCGQGPDWWVARHGDKLSFEEAAVHFPGGQLVRERYRE